MRIPGAFVYPLRKFTILDQTFQNHVNENGGREPLYRPSNTGTVQQEYVNTGGVLYRLHVESVLQAWELVTQCNIIPPALH
jgi:hypothetical protein